MLTNIFEFSDGNATKYLLIVGLCADVIGILVLKYFTFKNRIAIEILLTGFPSFVMNLMSVLSNTVLNNLVASYSTVTIAGMGIAKKIDMFAF